jgi:hypothetical protein
MELAPSSEMALSSAATAPQWRCLPPPQRHANFGNLDLETALARFLCGAGQLDWEEHANPMLASIDLLLYDNADPKIWAERLVKFLLDWGVPTGTIVSLMHHPPNGQVRFFQVEVPAKQEIC